MGHIFIILPNKINTIARNNIMATVKIKFPSTIPDGMAKTKLATFDMPVVLKI